MRPPRLTATRTLLGLKLTLALVLAAFSQAVDAHAQDGYKIEPLKEAPPSALSSAVRETLPAEGFRVVDGAGKVYAELWLRKATPASEKPGGAKGTVRFPFLADGELLGAVRFPAEGRDNRDQAIPAGVYTLRYGLQPVNGDHLGVSPYRDYALLLPAAKDAAVAIVPRKPLEERSAEAAGSSHPACLLLTGSSASSPTIKHDEEKDTWEAVVPLSLQVKGESGTASLHVQILLIGVLGA